MLTVGLVAIWSCHAQWISMFSNIPGPEYSTDGPGGRKLPEGLFIIIGRLAAWFVPALQLDDLIPRRAAVAGVFAMISLPAAFAALRLSRRSAFAEAIRRLTPRESGCLASGALLFCGCFVAGTSIAYRETMVLFAIPALLSFQYEPELPRAVRWAAFMMIPLMWGSYPALLFDIGFGPLHGFGGPLPTFGFWLLREIAWWWLFIILAAALFCIAGQAGLVTTEPTASHPRRRLHG
jgi:hypothetical protein